MNCIEINVFFRSLLWRRSKNGGRPTGPASLRRGAVGAGLLALAILVGVPILSHASDPRRQEIVLHADRSRPEYGIAWKLLEKEIRAAEADGSRFDLRVGMANVGAADRAVRAIGAELSGGAFCGSAGCDLRVFVESDKGWVEAIHTLGSVVSVASRSGRERKDIIIDNSMVWRWRNGMYQREK